jgi:p-aminobenzoyl-glutamate transporter AbgT
MMSRSTPRQGTVHMAKRAALIALGGTVLVVAASLVFLLLGGEPPGRNETTLTPPAGELLVSVVWVVLVFAVIFGIVLAVEWSRRRRAQMRANR